MADDLSRLLERLSAGVVLADANAQLRQQRLWLELAQGTPLLEGIDRQANLAIREVKFAFKLAPIRASLWRRVWNSLRSLFGFADPAHGARFELSSNESESVDVEVVVTRDQDGVWRTRQTQGADDARLRGARVRGLPL